MAHGEIRLKVTNIIRKEKTLGDIFFIKVRLHHFSFVCSTKSCMFMANLKEGQGTVIEVNHLDSIRGIVFESSSIEQYTQESETCSLTLIRYQGTTTYYSLKVLFDRYHHRK